jgi:FkbM family methyltransferase
MMVAKKYFFFQKLRWLKSQGVLRWNKIRLYLRSSRQSTRHTAQTIALVDCGAHTGAALRALQFHRAFTAIYAFEPNPKLFPILKANTAKLAKSYMLRLYDAAVWVHSDGVDLYLGDPDSSTLLPGKAPNPGSQIPIDYRNPIRVKSVAFSDWIRTTFQRGDIVIVKMDVEGAEYAVLDQMLQEDTLQYIEELYVEWHADRIASVPQDVHVRIKSAVADRTKLRAWQ